MTASAADREPLTAADELGDEGTFSVSMKVMRCANGETYEYALMIGGERVGQPTFLGGNPTPGRKRHALMILLGLHSDGRTR